MSNKGRSGINRALSWLKKTLEITEKTTAPDTLMAGVRPIIDTFGWERLSAEGGAENQNNQSNLGVDQAILAAVPEGTMRYVIFASASHNDPVAGGLTLTIQIKTVDALDIGIAGPVIDCPISPTRLAKTEPFLMAPGEQLLSRSTPAPAAGQRIFIRAKFVDIPVGEYVPPR